MNDFSAEMIGVSRSSLLGKNDKELFPANECEVFQQIDDEVLRTGNIISIRETLTDNLGFAHQILTKKGKIITKEGEELVIGISYTINDSELYKSDSVEDEYFNKTTLECIEKLIETFRSIPNGNRPTTDYFNSLSIDNAHHLLTRDREFLNEFVERIPFYACYINSDANLVVQNYHLEAFINNIRITHKHILDTSNNLQALNQVLFGDANTETTIDHDKKIINIADTHYLLLLKKIPIFGVNGREHGHLFLFDLLPLNYDANINPDYYKKNLKYEEFYNFIAQIEECLNSTPASIYNFPHQKLSLKYFNTIDDIKDIDCFSRKITNKLDKLLADHDISFKHWQILNVVVNNAHCNPSLISQHLGIINSRTTKLLNELESKGLIERRYQKKDRRLIRLWFTESGHQKWLLGKKIALEMIKSNSQG